MEKEIIKELKYAVNQDIGKIDDLPHFSDSRYKPYKIDKANFNPIKKSSTNKICFVDGGNAEILRSANISLHFIRIYYCTYLNNKKINSKKKEFYAMVNSIKKSNKIVFKTKLMPNVGLDEPDLEFDIYDETLRKGFHSIDISGIGEVARRFAELKVAEEAIGKLEKEDILLRDGSLQSSVTNEKKYFDGLYKKAIEKEVRVAGISKTCTLLTEKGRSLNGLINIISPKGTWYYYPIADIDHPDHLADIYFARLHEKSRHSFRVDVFKKIRYDINSILANLAFNAKDPVFLGYPYGLIEADRFARVSNNEREYLKTKILARLGKDSSTFSALDAHNILDNIGKNR